MKTKSNRLTCLATAAVALIASAASTQAATRTLMLLQENSSGKSYLEGEMDDFTRAAADRLIDSFVEGAEAAKFQRLAESHYQRFVNLSDADCTRAKLLDNLIAESKAGRTVDLAILGHGNDNVLSLHGDEELTGATGSPFSIRIVGGQVVRGVDPGTIRSLLTDARAREGAAFNFKLRLVHMCNCFGGTLNDDWLAIGAKVSVGAPLMDWMPEPMNTFFWDDFVKNDKRVADAAALSLARTRLIWQFVPGYTIVDPEIGLNKIQETQQLVSGNRDLIFKDECQLAVNQTRTVTVSASAVHNFANLFLAAGQTYSYNATGLWKSTFFAPMVNANGHAASALDAARRHPSNMMALIGERFGHNRDLFSFVRGSGFRIGASNTITATGHGFLNFFANDTLPSGYPDNGGSVTVTIRRTR